MNVNDAEKQQTCSCIGLGTDLLDHFSSHWDRTSLATGPKTGTYGSDMGQNFGHFRHINLGHTPHFWVDFRRTRIGPLLGYRGVLVTGVEHAHEFESASLYDRPGKPIFDHDTSHLSQSQHSKLWGKCKCRSTNGALWTLVASRLDYTFSYWHHPSTTTRSTLR